MNGGAEYRIEALAQASGATVRTIRAYQDRGLLPRAERRGRANVYGEAHLVRLRQIADLLERGYSLASIKELLEAWDTGRGLGGVLGLGRDEAFVAASPQEPAVGFELYARGVEERSVALPAGTIRSVERLVGAKNVAAFIAAATERELQARTLDALTPTERQIAHIDQIG